MTTATVNVGSIVLPANAGTTNTAIPDPLVTGLLDYLAFCLNDALSAKLANLHGTSPVAVPVKNRFPWDPAAYFVRGHQDGAGPPFPALYVWRRGKGRREQLSMLTDARRVDVGVLYVFDELVLPGALEDRFGLRTTVDAAFHDAASNGYHPAYGYNGAPLGTPIDISLGLAGFGLLYDGGEEGMMAPIPGQSEALGRGSEGHVLHAYPTLLGGFSAWEAIGQRQLRDPEDVTQGFTATISVPGDGDLPDALPLMTRILSAPDGSEQPGT
jgi:hypothetical protein